MKKLFTFFAVLSMILPIAFAQVTNPDHYIIASIGDPDTLDPAKCYDNASGILLFNVYETLVFWDENNLDEFVGFIAEDFTISPDGLTYTFTIREGIPWHDPAYGTVTAEDVEYSLERVMVLDYTGGPEWMLFEPLLGCFHADTEDPGFGAMIDNAVTRDGNVITLHLYQPYPILHVLANCYGGSILCKQWCIDHGDWPGTFDNWVDYHDPENPWMDDLDHSSPGPHLDAMMGCGPYYFDYWDHGIEWSVKKFDDYWRGWPNPETTYLGHQRRGYVSTFTYKKIEDWAPRRDGFTVGDYDNIYVPREYISQIQGIEGIECLYPYPGYGVTGMFFGFNVSTASPYLGVDGGLPESTLDETGICPNFFSDVHVRKAFAYCVDYTSLIVDAWLGEAAQPTSPLCAGLAPDFRNPAQPVYSLDLEAAEAEFRLAWGGDVWTTGFTTGVAYNTGNVPRQTVCEMLKANIESLNPLFHIELFSVDWGGTYIPQLVTFQLNMFIIGWGADYPDAHNFMYTFMGEHGDFSHFQRIAYDDTVDVTTYPVEGATQYPFDTETTYGNAYVDALLAWGISLAGVDDVLRQAVYNTLQEIYFDQCGSVCLYDVWARRWQRTWVQGWYYHGIYPGSYAYALWKEELPREDMNEDGTVNILDIARGATAFGASFTPGEPIHLRWDPYADMNQDAQVNILDIAGVAMLFGWTA
jgi:peptide/nickel transport system substrate-binding protein